MKKLTLLVSAVLCIAMMFTFVSCGSEKTPEELIVGEWKTELDLGDYMAEAMGDTEGEYFDDLEFALVMNLSIKDGGKYDMSVDEAALEDALDDLKKDLKPGMKDMLDDMAAEMGATVEDIAAASGYDDIDEFLEDTLSGLTAESMLEEFEAIEGTYEIEDNKIYFIEDGDEKEDSDYAIFDVDSDTLKIDMSDEEKEEAEDGEFAAFVEFLPLEFTRK